MKHLWLKFRDEQGAECRVEVERAAFTIGRHSACDLTIPDSRLSREHLRIQRAEPGFTAADLGSSNGTLLNEQPLTRAVALRDGDVLDLGGGLHITIEIAAADEVEDPAPAFGQPDLSLAAAQEPAGQPTPAVIAAASGGGIPTAFFIVAPLMAIFVLAVVVGAIVLFKRGESPVAANPRDEDHRTEEMTDEPDDTATPKPGTTATPFRTETPSKSDPDDPPSGNEAGPTPTVGDDVAVVERNAAEFLKSAAGNDSNAFITSEQARRVQTKIRQISSWPLAENLRSARQGSAKIKSAAATRGLKPEFLAVGALLKLGSSRGEVATAADAIAEPFDKMADTVGSALGDDVLLVVAFQGLASSGEYGKPRLLFDGLGRAQNSANPREIRTVWYLEKAGKLSAADVDRALTFLAIGTIAQNPKAFGVNAEALKL